MKYEDKKYVCYTADEMFDLVKNIELYHLFIPGCSSVEVKSRKKDSQKEHIDAIMNVSYGPWSYALKSCIVFDSSDKTITVKNDDDHFDLFYSQWSFFEEVEDKKGSFVAFKIEMDFKSKSLKMISSMIPFEKLASHVSDAFIKRAQEIYQ